MRETSFEFELNEEMARKLEKFVDELVKQVLDPIKRLMEKIAKIYDEYVESNTTKQSENLVIDAKEDRNSTWRYKQNGIPYAAEPSMHPE